MMMTKDLEGAQMPDFKSPKMIEANGIQLAVYDEKPEGEAHEYPLILCHGMPELAYSWRHQFDDFVAAGYHVIATDTRGVGHSQVLPNREDYTLDERLKDMCGVLDAFGYEKGIFIGHDFGGAIVWGMGLYHPDRVAGLIALNSPFADMPMNPLDLYEQLYGPKNYFAYFQTQECEDKLNEDTERSFRFYMRRDVGEGTNLSRSREHDPESLSHVHWIHDDESTWPGEVIPSDEELKFYAASYARHGFGPALNWYRCLPLDYENQQKVFPNGLPKIEHPVLAVGSDLDFIAAHTFYDLLDGYCTDWQKVVIEGAGHWTQQEAPEALNKTLVEWLDARFG